MPALPSTVAVSCPRCDQDIVCTLEISALPSDDPKRRSMELEASVPDLAASMQRHYTDFHA